MTTPILALLCTLTITQAPARERLVILDLAANDVDRNLVNTISDSIAVTLQQQRIVADVTSAADLRALINVDADRRTLGVQCEAKESCMAELAQALGADLMVHGSVGRYASLYVVSLSLFDARANRALAREKVESASLELLSQKVEYATNRLALAYAGKPLALAGTEPQGSATIDTPLLWTGGLVGSIGVAACVTGAVLAATATSTIADPLSSGAQKASAQATHPLSFATAIGGGVGVVVGAGLVVAALVSSGP